ncbi:hypothetical protein [Rhodococcus sp. UNC363MFTsu5.1]|uniref:hypothetical protein n=1 Tax=Rhodococcus sp. UNC363MFTsu5.1 TaxID=1449069 RepID=UPI0004879D45|nr:hypothetical protein [Rhodococcus sp. UNC363MFTsu5.1]
MTNTFLSRAEQQALITLLGEVGEVVEALAAALTTNGARTRISYEPRVTTGERVQPLPYNEDARIAADDLHNELGLWVQLVIDYRGIDYEGADTAVAYARWLKAHIEPLALTPGAHEAPRSIGKAVKAAKRAARMGSPREEEFSKLRAKIDPRIGELHEEKLNARSCVDLARQFGVTITQRRIDYLVTHKQVTPLGIVKGIDGVRYRIFRFGDVLEAAQADTMEETA